MKRFVVTSLIDLNKIKDDPDLAELHQKAEFEEWYNKIEPNLKILRIV